MNHKARYSMFCCYVGSFLLKRYLVMFSLILLNVSINYNTFFAYFRPPSSSPPCLPPGDVTFSILQNTSIFLAIHSSKQEIFVQKGPKNVTWHIGWPLPVPCVIWLHFREFPLPLRAVFPNLFRFAAPLLRISDIWRHS